MGSWYYQILVGGSIVYNLLFMLITFLAGEGVKNYQESYSKVLFVLGTLQVCRIFILPMQAHAASVKIGGAETAVMGDGQFIRCIVYLTGSAACLIVSGIINMRKAAALKHHIQASSGNAKEAA